MSEDTWEIISVILLSSVKFSIGGVPLAIFLKFSFIKAVITTSAGGILGVIVFNFISEWIIHTGKKITNQKPGTGKKKIFTWQNKLIISTKNKMGLAGLAIITPLFLSIPLGVFLAVRYYKNRKKVIAYMAGAVITCSIVLSVLKFLF